MDFTWFRSDKVERVYSFGSQGFNYRLILSGPVSLFTNCTEEDLRTSSRRIMGASLPPLKDINLDAVGREGRSAVAKLNRIWTPTDI